MAVESFLTRWRKAVRPLPREAPSAALLALKRRQRRLIQRTLAILVLAGAGGWIYSYWASAPDRAQAETALGVKLLGVGTYDQAMRHFDRAIQIWPDYADAYLSRGLAEHGASHRDARRSPISTERSNLDPSLTQAYNERGQIYLENGDVQKTIQDCSKSIQVNPTVDAYYQRGEAYEKLGEHQKAIADFDAAIAGVSRRALRLSARAPWPSCKRRSPGRRADDDQARRIETGQVSGPRCIACALKLSPSTRHVCSRTYGKRGRWGRRRRRLRGSLSSRTSQPPRASVPRSPAADRDWVQETEDAWPPLLVGEKFFVVAPGARNPHHPARFRLEINPGMQCGTGQHPCTRLCLEAMERVIQPGDRVLDVGTGSGISRSPPRCWERQRWSLATSTRDAAREALFFIGSVDAVRGGAFDVVMANISEIVIGDLKPEFERVAPRRILSGFQDAAGEWTCVIE